MPELASLSATVYGKVQGVYFRDFVARQASALGIAGWVKNLPDGRSVAVKAEGDKAALETLLGQLRLGPPDARVDRMEVEWSQYAGSFASFEIRS